LLSREYKSPCRRERVSPIRHDGFCLELDQQGNVDVALGFRQIGAPALDQAARCALVSARRRNSSEPAEIGHAGVMVQEFRAKCHIGAEHVVESERPVPGLERIARILSEVRRSRSSRGRFDRGKKNEIPAGIGDAPQGQSEHVTMEPKPILEYEAKEVLGWSTGRP